MNKIYIYLAFILLGLFLSVPYLHPFAIFRYDASVYDYGGHLLLNGGKIYQDLFDHKWPFIYYVFALGNLFGTNGTWIIYTLLYITGIISFYKITEKIPNSIRILLTVLFAFLAKNYVFLEGSFLTRELVLYLLPLVALLCYKKTYWLIGILLAIILSLNATSIIAVTAMVLIIYSTSNWKGYKHWYQFIKIALKPALTVIIFFLITTLLFFLPYFNILSEVKRLTLDFNTEVYAEPNVLLRYANMLQGVIESPGNTIMILCIFLVIFIILCYRFVGKYALLVSTPYLLDFVTLAATGKSFNHYYTILPFYFLFAAILVLKEIYEKKHVTIPIQLSQKALIPVGFFILISIIFLSSLIPNLVTFSTHQVITPIRLALNNKYSYADAFGEVTWWKSVENKPNKYDIYVFDNLNAAALSYKYFNTISPTKFFYTHFDHYAPVYLENQYKNSEYLKQKYQDVFLESNTIISDLKNKKTKYIVRYKDTDKNETNELIIRLNELLNERYSLVDEGEDYQNTNYPGMFYKKWQLYKLNESK